MRYATDLRVRHRAAQCLAVHNLPRCTLHEVGTAESHEGGAFHHEYHVGQRRQVRAASNARTHDSSDLRHVQIATHDGVVVENPCSSVLARKDAALIRQVHARRIDEIDDGNAAAHRDFLRAQDLSNRLRPPRPRFHGGIIGDNHNFAPFHNANTGDDAGAGRLSVVLIVGHEEADFEKARAGVTQAADAFASGEFPLRMLMLNLFLAAALPEPILELVYLGGELPKA